MTWDDVTWYNINTQGHLTARRSDTILQRPRTAWAQARRPAVRGRCRWRRRYLETLRKQCGREGVPAYMIIKGQRVANPDSDFSNLFLDHVFSTKKIRKRERQRCWGTRGIFADRFEKSGRKNWKGENWKGSKKAVDDLFLFSFVFLFMVGFRARWRTGTPDFVPNRRLELLISCQWRTRFLISCQMAY